MSGNPFPDTRQPHARPVPDYYRRRLETTAFYQVLQEHLETFMFALKK